MYGCVWYTLSVSLMRVVVKEHFMTIMEINLFIYHNYGDIAVCARVWIVIVGDGGGGVCI